MTRIAHCCCGSLRAETTGEPALVVACHCMECQRRTGSPFGVSACFPIARVRTEGPSNVYVRGNNSGRKNEFHFCPNCGSTVFWYPEVAPDLIGIAFGAFADPSMPWPKILRVETARHPWVTFDHELDHFVHQPELIEDPADSPPVSASRAASVRSVPARPDDSERAAWAYGGKACRARDPQAPLDPDGVLTSPSRRRRDKPVRLHLKHIRYELQSNRSLPPPQCSLAWCWRIA